MKKSALLSWLGGLGFSPAARPWLVFFIVLSMAIGAQGAAVIIDHTCARIVPIPESAVLAAKKSLHIAYGHSSHGGQLITGMNGLTAFMNGKGYPNNLYAWNGSGSGGALHLVDDPFSGASDLGDPSFTAWEGATRAYLNAHPEINVIIWSWCGQVSGASSADITTYLSLMNQLGIDFPTVKFVYMTGHLDGSGSSGNLNLRNNQIRDYCRQNNKILFDFADIESYDPDGQTHYMPLLADDNCDYDSNGDGYTDKNWATAWQGNHTENVDWYNCSPDHTQALNGNLKAYAAWWLWARLAGWNGENQMDFLGTWDSQGVAFRNSKTGGWATLSSPADMIAAGDLDGDGKDDLIGIWPGQGGVWIQYSKTGAWAKLSITARDIATGDMNGDGRVDLVATYDDQGVFYRDSLSGAWVHLATPAEQVAAGDLNGDGKADLIGIWSGQGGVWVKYSTTGAWALLSTTAFDIAAGEMSGDGRVDFVATWSGQGVFYRNSISGAWVYLASPANQVAAGDLDDDGRADLIGVWPGQNGVWAHYSKTGNWHLLSTTARHMGTGFFRGGIGAMLSNPPWEVRIAGLEFYGFQDFSALGPGGNLFRCREEKNLIPQASDPASFYQRIPGPGEPGFLPVIEKDLKRPRIERR
jgi:hypothetical protein